MVFGLEQENKSLITPMALAHLAIQLAAVRVYSELDGVLPPEGLGSGPYTQYIIWVVETDSFWETCTCQGLVWPWRCVGWYNASFLSDLVLDVYFNCGVQDSLCQNMDMGVVWHYALVSTLSHYMGLFLGYALFWCWVSLFVPFINSLIDFYFIMTIVSIIGIFMAILFLLNYMFKLLTWNIFPSDSFMSCLDSLLWYAIGEFQALQMSVLMVFGAGDYALASCMLVDIFKIKFEMIVRF